MFHSIFTRSFICVVSITLVCSLFEAAEAMPVFPGAKGFGSDTRAAYGGTNRTPVICIVDSLATTGGTCGDSERNGVAVKTGTLRQCIDHPSGGAGKIILFEVSGTIHATSSPYLYYIDDAYMTIAGQTAPSPGITLRNITLHSRTHDVLVQHVRFRVGDAASGENPDWRRSLQMISGWGGTDVYNNVFDHCSASWSTDSNCTNWVGPDSSLHDNTWSNCIISEGLSNSLHSKGEHSKGFVLGPGTTRISAIGNLMAHNVDRNPYLRCGSSVIMNNLIYNPGDFNIGLEDAGGPITTSLVGNVVKGGPSSHTYARNKLPTFWNSLLKSSQIYLFDNKCDAGTQTSETDWSFVRWGGGLGDLTNDVQVLSPPTWPSGLEAALSSTVEEAVLAIAGARPADRDSVDIRIVNDVRNGTGRIIDSPSDVGGWPVLAENYRRLNIPNNPHGDEDADGYTNLEEWLHRFAAQIEGNSTISPPKGLRIK